MNEFTIILLTHSIFYPKLCFKAHAVLYKPVHCGSSKCKITKGIGCLGCNGTPRPACTNNTCPLFSYNPFNNSLRTGGLGEDNIYVYETGGRSVLLHINAPRFPFVCADSGSLNGLAKGTIVKIKTSLLSIDKKGVGGTKISTINPSTILHTSIYKVAIKDFVKKAASGKIIRVASMAPFGACFSSKTIASTMTRPAVPTIDLGLQSKSVYWRIYGANWMVKVKENVLCLGVVDGGLKPRTSIVTGGHQLEDNMLE